MDQKVTREKKDERCFAMHFLCLQSKSFIDSSIFYFGINTVVAVPKIEFANYSFHKGIEIWLIDKFLFQVEERTHD